VGFLGWVNGGAEWMVLWQVFLLSYTLHKEWMLLGLAEVDRDSRSLLAVLGQ
jgi:hypothetical protein